MHWRSKFASLACPLQLKAVGGNIMAHATTTRLQLLAQSARLCAHLRVLLERSLPCSAHLVLMQGVTDAKE